MDGAVVAVRARCNGRCCVSLEYSFDNPPATPQAALDVCGQTLDLGAHANAVHALCAELEATAVARDKQGGSAFEQHALLRASGLTALAVPQAYGGAQAPWSLILRAVRRIAQSDSSLGHIFAFQHLQVATVLLFGSPAQQQRLLQGTVQHRWLWGNAVNARDTRLDVQPQGDGFVLQGIKSFCSGTRGSDMMTVSVALGTAPAERLFATIPTTREGVTALDDWDAIGQRQTDSGTVRFEAVPIHADEILRDPGPASSPYATLRNMLAQTMLTENYLGNALGALRLAADYTREHAKAWAMAGVQEAVEDPYLLLRGGDLWMQLRGAVALSELANRHFDQAWQQGLALTAAQRGALSVDVAAARSLAARTALQVTSQIFEMVGARATANRNGFDRFWRNVRTHTLHDPIDYRLKEVGRWLLTGAPPNPYSYG